MQRARFIGRSDFYATLKHRVDHYFEETGLPKTGTWRLFLKTGIILTLMVGSYIHLVFYAETFWTAVCAALGLAAGKILVGFNLMHDGAHGAYSSRKWLSWAMGATADLLGGSHYLWRQKHNVLHHSYTNIDVLDRDLSSSGTMRLSPVQDWKPIHRFQHWYALPLYCLGTLIWHFRNDYIAFLSGRFGPVPFARPRRADATFFWGAKAFYYGYALVLPSFFHPFWQVVLAFVGIHFLLGLVMFLVFQLAHTTEGPAFHKIAGETGDIENTWAMHEAETTTDFAPNTWLVTWCLGGLNFHIEHHLFPKISHVHYPAISAIVRETCREYGITYHCHPTFRAAIRAHLRHLKQMGQPPIEKTTPAGAEVSPV